MTQSDGDSPDRQGVQLGNLRENLPFLTRALRAHIRAENAGFFADFDAQQGELVVICLIGLNPGTSQNDVASTLVFKKSAVTKLIKTLEDRGLVQREKVAADKRYNALTLTEAGHAKFERINQRMREQHEALLAPFSADEKQQLFGLLNRLLDHMAERGAARQDERGMLAGDDD
jgi:DNA-binding MarR family transcriptional regulator